MAQSQGSAVLLDQDFTLLLFSLVLCQLVLRTRQPLMANHPKQVEGSAQALELLRLSL